jgi:hypothetical protein
MQNQQSAECVRRDMIRHAIIPPDDGSLSEEVLKQTRIVIDSRDRNLAAYPSPSQYAVDLPEDINLVSGIQLKTVWFPFSAFHINGTNNRFSVRYGTGGAWTRIQLPHGDYSGSDRGASVIDDALSRAGFADIGVSYNGDRYVFSCQTSAFQLCFDPASEGATAGRVLGFGQSTYTRDNNTGTLAAPYRINLSDYNRYVVLQIDPMDSLMSTNESINGSFAVLYKHKIEAGIDVTFEERFPTPLARMSRFAIKVLDYKGLPYDSQNQDHVFELLITHSPTTRKNW